ncbi:MAG: EAL domain-containing protein [Thermoanaerobaculia bacterium]
MSDALETLLRDDTSTTLFQPIYDVSGARFDVWAVEALTRGPAGTHFEPAPIFFDYVRHRREEVRVDRWCIAAAFARYVSLAISARLTVNVHASTLERDSTFASYIESAAVATDLDPTVLIVELVESSPYFAASRVLTVLRDLRSLGVSIAIDDVGAGHGNFRTILDAQPEYLKIDRYFVAGAAADARRRSIITSIVQVARDFGALVVGEGVDDPADLIVLREMNVPLVQGFLLAMPVAQPRLDVLEAALLLHPDLERREA